MDSRFGPERSVPVAIRLSQWPEPGAAVFYDMTPAGPVPTYSFEPDPEMARRCMADAILRESPQYDARRVSIRVQNTSPSTLGRGSP